MYIEILSIVPDKVTLNRAILSRPRQSSPRCRLPRPPPRCFCGDGASGCGAPWAQPKRRTVRRWRWGATDVFFFVGNVTLKPMGNHRKTQENIGHLWENHRKTIGKPRENQGKTKGKPWEHGGLASGIFVHRHGKSPSVGSQLF